MGRRKRKKKSLFNELESEVTSSVVGIIILAIAIVVVLAYFGVASGWFSDMVARGLTFLFGGGAIIFPLVLLIASLYILLSHKPKVIGTAMFGGILILLSLLGFIEVLGKNGGHLGGWVGLAFSWPFYKALGFWGATVIFFAIFISGILITFRIPLKSYARNVFVRDDEYEEKEVEKGLIETITDAARLVLPKKEQGPPLPADETVTVNLPSSRKDKDAKEKQSDNIGFTIIPLSKEYDFPPLDLLEEETGSPVSGDIKANALIIQKTLENFNIPVEMGEVNVGPAITQFTLKPALGVKLSKITALHNDISLALAAHPIRIEAPIPGKSLVGIEIPNEKSMLVRLSGMLDGFDRDEFQTPLNLAIGRDVAGSPYWTTLTNMPHLLIAGATGTGKSIAINSILLSLLFQHPPEILRLILIDPKRVELTLYNGIPHLLTPVITKPKKAIASLRWAVSEMEHRYEELSEAHVRNIQGYNTKQKAKKNSEFMPYLIIVIDELADLMAAYGRELEGAVVRLAQMARAVGIHLIVSTQRPSVEVITGLIKANITSRIAFQVASQVDSRTILDISGAEKLLGNGDMLFMGPEFSKPRRFQGTLVSEKEVKRVVKFLKENFAEAMEEEEYEDDDGLESALEGNGRSGIDLDKFSKGKEHEDELYSEALELVVSAGKASASLLQRRLRVGYARAARLLDMLEDEGIVGPSDGAKPREVFKYPESEGNDDPSAQAGEKEYEHEEEEEEEEEDEE